MNEKMIELLNFEWASNIRNFYWDIRMHRRDLSRRRRLYERISAEKKRIASSGIDPELVRLYCRHLVNPRSPHALAALSAFFAASENQRPLNS